MMKKTIFLSAAALLLGVASPAKATQLFGEPFNYPDGTPIVGQSGWGVQAANSTNPITVTGGVASMANTGQDDTGMFATSLTPVTGNSIYFALTINVSAAQATGDYFFATNVSGTSTFNADRLYIKSSGAGFVLGADGSSGGTVPYGTTVLSLGTSYQIVFEENFVAGATNNPLTIYVNPTDRTTEANNTPYASLAYTGTQAESASYGSILLRQGSATAAPTLTIDNVGATTTFAEAAAATQPLVFGAVPEPSTYATLALGGLGALAMLRYRRRMA